MLSRNSFGQQARMTNFYFDVFLVDKSGAGGLDDWEVKIADFVVLLGKDAKKFLIT